MVVMDSVGDFQIGRVVSRTFKVFGRNLGTYVIVAAVILIPVIAINLYVGTPNYIVAGRTKGLLFGALAAIIPMICTYLLQAALVQGTITYLNGERPDVGRALSTGFALLIPVTIIAILSLLGMALGIVLLIVPGLIVLVGWSVAVPVKVVERTSITDSFRRSWNLTKGYRWKIFGLVMIYGIAVLLLAVAIGMVVGVSIAQTTTALHNTPYIVLQWMQSVFVAILTAVGGTALYYELRAAKEGLSPQQLAEAFD